MVADNGQGNAAAGAGPKRPIWRRWWFWVVGAVVVIVIIGAAAGSRSEKPPHAAIQNASSLGPTSTSSSATASSTTDSSTTTAPAPTTTAPAPTTTAPAPTTTTAPAPTTTATTLASQTKEAVAEARQYLTTEAFSKQALITQLDSPYGGHFTATQATAAVDSLTTVNWTDEAVKEAKNYLTTEPFSCQALITQLDSPYGGHFTAAQATYGATQAGAC